MEARAFRGPPPIGEALAGGWNAYKANFGPVLLGTLCAVVCGFVPLIGGFIASAGIHMVSLKAVRGIKPEPADGFIGFKKIVDCIIIGLLQAIGALLCCIGQIVTQPLFLPGGYFLFDRDVGWSEAKDMCITEVKPHLLNWVIFYFLLGLVGTVLAICGLLMCGVGLFFVMPILNCTAAYAYNYSFGKPVLESPPEAGLVEQPAA